MTGGGRVDDRKPGVAEYDIATPHNPLIIRSAVPLRFVHPNNRVTLTCENTGNATHREKLTADDADKIRIFPR